MWVSVEVVSTVEKAYGPNDTIAAGQEFRDPCKGPIHMAFLGRHKYNVAYTRMITHPSVEGAMLKLQGSQVL